MSDACEELETGIVGFTFANAGRVVKESGIKGEKPENDSDFTTVSGPANAAEKANLDGIMDIIFKK
ncbi:MAG: hypothetical protein LBI42_02420 [Chitinispirillales bacterium]|jgi:hypothetical protein|nr:hypothetical protein [Chitinispirillales bacterium]